MQFPTIHLNPSISKYILIKRYEFLHYRSFWKVNKNTFWVKASYMNMEDSIDMRPKFLLGGHLKISKKSKNTCLGSKLKELCIGKVYPFCKIAKSQMCPKLQFLSNGPNFLYLHWVCNVTHDPWSFHLSFFYFCHLFWFLFQLNQIKSK